MRLRSREYISVTSGLPSSPPVLANLSIEAQQSKEICLLSSLLHINAAFCDYLWIYKACYLLIFLSISKQIHLSLFRYGRLWLHAGGLKNPWNLTVRSNLTKSIVSLCVQLNSFFLFLFLSFGAEQVWHTESGMCDLVSAVV